MHIEYWNLVSFARITVSSTKATLTLHTSPQRGLSFRVRADNILEVHCETSPLNVRHLWRVMFTFEWCDKLIAFVSVSAHPS
jgi:hypothetical protein